ncbi:MAG: hypothetical protein RPU41_13965 [Candidatus Sedimenticola sp. (ex Thyasira tokunagai)]
MNIDQLVAIVLSNLGTLSFALIGAILLTGIAIKEHLDRDEKDKMSKIKYFVYFFGWLFGYPFIGLAVAVAYLANENQFGSWLALQIGLTSPAIIVGIANSGANTLAKEGLPTVPDQ